MASKPKVNWDELRENYINHPLGQPRPSYQECAKAAGVAHATLAVRAAKENWQGQAKAFDEQRREQARAARISRSAEIHGNIDLYVRSLISTTVSKAYQIAQAVDPDEKDALSRLTQCVKIAESVKKIQTTTSIDNLGEALAILDKEGYFSESERALLHSATERAKQALKDGVKTVFASQETEASGPIVFLPESEFTQ